MGTIATFTATYLQPPPNNVLPAGPRQQVAGAVYALAQQGGLPANVNTARMNRILYPAERRSSPNQPTLVADFYAITGP